MRVFAFLYLNMIVPDLRNSGSPIRFDFDPIAPLGGNTWNSYTPFKPLSFVCSPNVQTSIHSLLFTCSPADRTAFELIKDGWLPASNNSLTLKFPFAPLTTACAVCRATLSSVPTWKVRLVTACLACSALFPRVPSVGRTSITGTIGI